MKRTWKKMTNPRTRKRTQMMTNPWIQIKMARIGKEGLPKTRIPLRRMMLTSLTQNMISQNQKS
jgi:hypothetical protein